MDKAYEPQKHEMDIAQKWEQSKVFHASALKKSKTKKSFTIPLPPPNVTGTLHLGHAMMLVIEDIMSRYHRMRGDATLWLPGTDHAAIATETVVLKHLKIQDRNKEISREKFLQECWNWTKKSHDTIVEQMKKMGASCDWTRERFTMDMGLSNAVNTIFTDLYNAGLIYRGERMINWSVGAQSVLADDELNWEERDETLYYIQCGEFVIATVRPETKCADSPVVVNPKDKRYKHLIGKEFEYETYAGKRTFYVLADEHIDPEFGTGAMTISTAHDANDFEIAKRHKLPFPRKIDFDGKMTELAGPCAGMTVLAARKKSVEIMREKGLIVKEEPYRHRVPLCYRTNTVVEPMISTQWFIDVNKEFMHPVLKQKTTLKKLTADAVRKGAVKIVPERFEKIYFQWIDHLRDWCISRQVWWGHRIPVWYGQSQKSKVESQKSSEEIFLMQKQRLIFARHGECEYNRDMLVSCHFDSPLTEEGKKQAADLAEKLKKTRNVTKIIASPLARSRDTAQIVADALGLSVEVWEELIEVDAGEMTGQPIADLATIFERAMQAKNAETQEKVLARAARFWEKVSQLKPSDGEVLFVGHGMFTAAIFAYRDGVSAENLVEYWQRSFMGNGTFREMTYMLPPQGDHLEQDPDTLDTWFSSALWPFSTLGWPDTTSQDFQDFFPTSILETGHDILFFWVARMIMFSSFATGKVPFHTVYLHGMVCDEKGQKMSKSKGNGIDPLNMIQKFGTDALRMAMIVGTTPGNPVNLGEKKIEGYRNFANKLWNVARFILAMDDNRDRSRPLSTPNTLTEKWLLSRTQNLIVAVTKGLEEHRYGEVGQMLYEFTWSELADWGIEASKADNSENTPAVFRFVLETLLKLLHPYTPFVTEKIWEELWNHYKGDTAPCRLLANEQWPEQNAKLLDPQAEEKFQFLQSIISTIRSLRSEKKVEAGKQIPVYFSGKNLELLRDQQNIIRVLGRISEITFGAKPDENGVTEFVSGTEIFLPLSGMIDLSEEKKRLQNELKTAQETLAKLQERLANKAYVESAPAHLVEQTRTQQTEVQARVQMLSTELQNL